MKRILFEMDIPGRKNKKWKEDVKDEDFDNFLKHLKQNNAKNIFEIDIKTHKKKI